jgi:hypothetical protein
MTEAKPVPESRLKHAATLVASIAALLTSCAAFLEAYDKTVERESYEVLAAKIVELQEVQTQAPPSVFVATLTLPMDPRPSLSSNPSAAPLAIQMHTAQMTNPPRPPGPPAAARSLAPPPSWEGLKK